MSFPYVLTGDTIMFSTRDFAQTTIEYLCQPGPGPALDFPGMIADLVSDAGKEETAMMVRSLDYPYTVIMCLRVLEMTGRHKGYAQGVRTLVEETVRRLCSARRRPTWSPEWVSSSEFRGCPTPAEYGQDHTIDQLVIAEASNSDIIERCRSESHVWRLVWRAIMGWEVPAEVAEAAAPIRMFVLSALTTMGGLN